MKRALVVLTLALGACGWDKLRTDFCEPAGRCDGGLGGGVTDGGGLTGGGVGGGVGGGTGTGGGTGGGGADAGARVMLFALGAPLIDLAVVELDGNNRKDLVTVTNAGEVVVLLGEPGFGFSLGACAITSAERVVAVSTQLAADRFATLRTDDDVRLYSYPGGCSQGDFAGATAGATSLVSVDLDGDDSSDLAIGAPAFLKAWQVGTGFGNSVTLAVNASTVIAARAPEGALVAASTAGVWRASPTGQGAFFSDGGVVLVQVSPDVFTAISAGDLDGDGTTELFGRRSDGGIDRALSLGADAGTWTLMQQGSAFAAAGAIAVTWWRSTSDWVVVSTATGLQLSRVASVDGTTMTITLDAPVMLTTSPIARVVPVDLDADGLQELLLMHPGLSSLSIVLSR